MRLFQPLGEEQLTEALLGSGRRILSLGSIQSPSRILACLPGVKGLANGMARLGRRSGRQSFGKKA